MRQEEEVVWVLAALLSWPDVLTIILHSIHKLSGTYEMCGALDLSFVFVHSDTTAVSTKALEPSIYA